MGDLAARELIELDIDEPVAQQALGVPVVQDAGDVHAQVAQPALALIAIGIDSQAVSQVHALASAHVPLDGRIIGEWVAHHFGVVAAPVAGLVGNASPDDTPLVRELVPNHLS
jgi:hypothetical protein